MGSLNYLDSAASILNMLLWEWKITDYIIESEEQLLNGDSVFFSSFWNRENSNDFAFLILLIAKLKK